MANLKARRFLIGVLAAYLLFQGLGVSLVSLYALLDPEWVHALDAVNPQGPPLHPGLQILGIGFGLGMTAAGGVLGWWVLSGRH